MCAAPLFAALPFASSPPPVMTEWQRQREHRKRPQPPQMRARPPVAGPVDAGVVEVLTAALPSGLAHRWHSSARSRCATVASCRRAGSGGESAPEPAGPLMLTPPAPPPLLPPPPRTRLDDMP
jgi:hypothetical protein